MIFRRVEESKKRLSKLITYTIFFSHVTLVTVHHKKPGIPNSPSAAPTCWVDFSVQTCKMCHHGRGLKWFSPIEWEVLLTLPCDKTCQVGGVALSGTWEPSGEGGKRCKHSIGQMVAWRPSSWHEKGAHPNYHLAWEIRAHACPVWLFSASLTLKCLVFISCMFTLEWRQPASQCSEVSGRLTDWILCVGVRAYLHPYPCPRISQDSKQVSSSVEGK